MQIPDTITSHNEAKYITLIVLLLLSFATSCEYDYFPVPPPPKIPVETATLEASYTFTAPLTLNAKYWTEADYLKVAVADVNKGMLYGDGLLNMTGTFNGIAGFNSGNDPNVVMKAAYDDSKLYILVEWTDSDIDPSLAASKWNGPLDPLKTDTSGKWTSQGNCDGVVLAFEISPASSSSGTFIQKGCAASCHNGKMQPETGKVDFWYWNLAISEPLGYANDMVSDAANGLTNDAGQAMAVRNKVDTGSSRSAPAYEWDGVEQIYTRPDGNETTMHPAFFLKNKIPFTGDPELGYFVYHNSVYGCNHCHGDNGLGNGPYGDGTAFNTPLTNGKMSRAGMMNYAATHDGASYYNQVPVSDRDNLMAYIRGLSGLPGYFLTTPAGSNTDVWSVSNVPRSNIQPQNGHTLYKVLLIRSLVTDNSDDVQFSSPAGKTYPFGIAFMDNDGKNHIGSLKQELTFK